MKKSILIVLLFLLLITFGCTEKEVKLISVFSKTFMDERYDRIIIDNNNLYLIRLSSIENYQDANSYIEDGIILKCNLNADIINKINPYSNNFKKHFNYSYFGYWNFNIINDSFIFLTREIIENRYTIYLTIYNDQSGSYNIKHDNIYTFYCKDEYIFFTSIINNNFRLNKYNLESKINEEIIIKDKDIFDVLIKYNLFIDKNILFVIDRFGRTKRYDIISNNLKTFEYWDILKGKVDVSKIIKEEQLGNGACFYFNNGKYYSIYPLLNNEGYSDEALLTIYDIHKDEIETCITYSYGYTVYPRKMYYPTSDMKRYWRFIGPEFEPFHTGDGDLGYPDTISNPLKMAVDDEGYIYIFDNYLSKLTKYELK